MILVDKRLPNAYNLLYQGSTDDVHNKRIAQYYKDFRHVRVVPYSVIRQRVVNHRTSENTFGEHLTTFYTDPGQIDYDNFHQALGHNKTAHYRRIVKMHWLINDMLEYGLNDPMTAVVYPNMLHEKIEWNVAIHPGSFRQHAVKLTDTDVDVIVFDAFELFYDYPKKTLKEIFDHYGYIDKIDINMIHHDTNLMTPQMFNITDGSRHTSMSINTQAWEKKIRYMFEKPVNIFIGYDSTHGDASEVCKNSILKKINNENINIQMLDVTKIEGWTREYKNQSTEFSYTRFLVPYLSNYEGISIFCDDDFIFTENILNTIWFLNPDNAVACVQHDFEHKYDTKFTNTKDVWYDRKLWSSLMVFNNSHPDCKNLTLESVQEATGKYLHQFEWTTASIGKIPHKWNWCEGYSDLSTLHDSCGIHWTRGGPWIEGMDCTDIDGIEIWNWFKYKDEPNWKKAILDMSEYYDISWTEDDTGTQKTCTEINRDVR